MPQILLTHPDHGSKFALSEAEAEHDEQFGWSRYNPDTPAEETVVVAPKRKYTRRVVQTEQPNEDNSVSDESEGT